MEKSDEEIVDQVLGGHKQTFSVLVRRYQKQIFNLMYRYSGSGHEAADLSQEVFLRAFEKLGSFKPGYSFFSWLYTLALNRANDWKRSQNRKQINLKELHSWISEQDNNHSRQEKVLQRKEELIQLNKVLHMLHDETREILVLRFQYDCSVKEVAEIFSLSESAVKMRTSRGLKQLQDLMQGEGE